MRKLLQKEMAGQAMVDDIIPLQIGEEGRPEEGDKSLLAGGKPVQNGRRVVDGPDQLEFGNIEVLRCFENNLPRNTFIVECPCQLLGYFLAAAVGSS
ncbi:MAG: hypothetical protein ACD_75C01473G0008 [uncultured bacterium]|nr:MAG: hypothetical protein ACD_75C01473G0008 [uncultured bacterium]